MRKALAFWAVLWLLGPTLAFAQSPARMPVQGTLMDAAGAPVDGTLDVTFTLYADAAGTASLWTETQAVAFDAGAFAAYLGEVVPVNLAVFRDYTGVYLGVTIEGDEEMPLVQLATAPYAGFATFCGSASQVGGQTTEQLFTDFETRIGDTLTPYTDADAVDAMGAAGATNPLNHDRFTPSEAVTAMGQNGPTNPLNHDRYTDPEAVAAVAADGRYLLASGGTLSGALDADGLSLTNGLLTNRFVTDYAASHLTIIDNYPAGSQSTIAVPDVGKVEWLKVSVEVSNSDLAGVTLTLTDPAGTVYTLYDKGSTGTSLVATWPDPTPSLTGDLTTWVGQNPQGNWTLKVVDAAYGGGMAGDPDGEVVQWGIELQAISAGQLAIGGDLEVSGRLTGATNVAAARSYAMVLRAASKGYSTTQGDGGVWIDGTRIWTPTRSYGLVVIERVTGNVVFSANYDVYGNAADATAMATALANYDSRYIAVVTTHDEPAANRLTGGLAEELFRCGASPQVFASGDFQTRGAYLLIGICDLGMGTGIELYAGDVPSDPTAFVDTTVQILDGGLQLGQTSGTGRLSGRIMVLHDATGDVVAVPFTPAFVAANVGQSFIWSDNGPDLKDTTGCGSGSSPSYRFRDQEIAWTGLYVLDISSATRINFQWSGWRSELLNGAGAQVAMDNGTVYATLNYSGGDWRVEHMHGQVKTTPFECY